MTNIKTLSTVQNQKGIADSFTGIPIDLKGTSLNAFVKKSQFDNLMANYAAEKAMKRDDQQIV